MNRKEKKGYRCPFEKAIMIGKTRIEWKSLTIKTLEELQQHISEIPFIFLDSTAKIKIDRKTFPQNAKNSYFYFEYQWKNPRTEKYEAVNKKLEFRADTLLMRQKTIFKVDNSPIDPKDVKDFKLLYMNVGDPVPVGAFKVQFPDAEKMKNEIGLLVREQQKLNFDPKMILGEVEAYIRQFYGAIDRINLTNYLKNNFGVVEPPAPAANPKVNPAKPKK
jgi:hypothetical protein